MEIVAASLITGIMMETFTPSSAETGLPKNRTTETKQGRRLGTGTLCCFSPNSNLGFSARDRWHSNQG